MTPVQFRLVVSRVLIVGVGTSAALIAIGFVGSLLVGWDGSMLGARAGGGAPTDFGTIQAGLWALRPVAIAQAGLLVLVATPVVRVAASVIAFTLEGDRLYATITLAVLAILLTSLLILH